MKHSKQKGNLGFSAVVKELHKLGLNVFSEIGDYSKIDLIVEYQNKLIKVQVKYLTEKKNLVMLPVRKCGPNGYRYHYESSDVDVFAGYLPGLDRVIFVPATEACKNKSCFNLAIQKNKLNINQPKMRWICDYLDFFKAAGLNLIQVVSPAL